ncbi:MAG: ABC transporter substrate-binding protein [Armatimonadetes bacterium]|nr:ABC transporter substrate-binding protein [Armatimonadota bacterium]
MTTGRCSPAAARPRLTPGRVGCAALTAVLLCTLAVQAQTPRPGGTLVRASIYGDPENLDPILKTRIATVMVTMNIFEPLIKFDAERAVLVPGHAERWTASADGKRYTFYLRKGAMFHSGREVTADDFKYSLERLMHPGNISPFAWLLADVTGARAFQERKAREIAGIKVVDRYTLEITLDRFNVFFLPHLTSVAAAPVPREEVDLYGREFGAHPVGSGPFMFDRWKRDSEVVLKAFPRYYGGRPYLDRLVYRVMKEAAATEAEFDAGNVDFMVVRDPQYRKYKSHAVYRNHLVEIAELYTRHIGFNLGTSGAEWLDRRVRQAINHAIDRAIMVEKVLQGKAFSATGVLPPTIAGHNPGLRGYAYDPAKARRLLQDAGYGKGFTVEVLTTDHPAFGFPAVEAVMGYLQAVGIRVTPVLIEGGVLFERAARGQYQWYSASVGGDTHPAAYLRRRFHSAMIGEAGNFTRYRNPQVDRLLDDALATQDTARGYRLAREAERLIVEDAPWWFFNYNKAVIVHQPIVRGLRPIPTDIDFQPMEKVWFATPPQRRR